MNAYLKMKNDVCYKLVAVIMHHAWGGNTGHYTTYFLDHAQQQWFYADDEKVYHEKINCRNVVHV